MTYSARQKVVEITPEGFRSEDPMTAIEATAPRAPAFAPQNGKRTAYCHQQAAECASVATTVISDEIRQAYLNIEQAWLHLAPGIDSRQKVEPTARHSLSAPTSAGN